MQYNALKASYFITKLRILSHTPNSYYTVNNKRAVM